MYHDIISNSSPNTWDVSIGNFEKQMDYLFKQRYNVISLDDLRDHILEIRKLIKPSIVITFDDGMKGVYQFAFPIIKHYGFSATVFLISDFIGKKIVKNEETKEHLNYDEIKKMYKYGIQFGSHTLDHQILTRLSPSKAKYQIEESKKKLIESLNINIDYFCYPGGYFNEEVKNLAKGAGYKGACSTFTYGRNNKEADLFQLKRIGIYQSDSIFHFCFKLSVINEVAEWLKNCIQKVKWYIKK
jgi:peptidoglycan/xylan/chitin deacetylase (PgdA/CDA1 family)